MARTRAQIELAAKEAEAWLESLGDDADVEDPADLRAVAAAVRDVAEAETRLANAVQAARANGRSWGRIGLALGVTKQAARQRFGAETAVRRGT
jgi:hypothetical protein